MNEISKIKNLILDVLSSDGIAEKTNMNALQSLKIDDVKGPVVIVQNQALLSIQDRRSLVQVIKVLDNLNGNIELPVNISKATRRFRNGLIKQALKQTDGNITEAAKLLFVKRPALSTEISKYNLKKEIDE